MTDEQILNALKSCGDRVAICDDCPYYGKVHCSILAKQDIIERFNSLKAENAELTVSNEVLRRDVENLTRTLEEGGEEYRALKDKSNALQKEKKDAIEGVAERIKTAFYVEFDELIPSIMAGKIDEIVKEVLNEYEL